MWDLSPSANTVCWEYVFPIVRHIHQALSDNPPQWQLHRAIPGTQMVNRRYPLNGRPLEGKPTLPHPEKNRGERQRALCFCQNTVIIRLGEQVWVGIPDPARLCAQTGGEI